MSLVYSGNAARCCIGIQLNKITISTDKIRHMHEQPAGEYSELEGSACRPAVRSYVHDFRTISIYI